MLTRKMICAFFAAYRLKGIPAFRDLTLKLPGPYVGMGGPLTVTVA